MVPIPVVDSFEALNAMLADKCRKRGQAVLRGHTTSIDARMAEDLALFMVLPSVPFDPCHIITGRASSMSLARYRTNDYSVPTTHAHREVVIKGYVDRVDIICHAERIASHDRSYAREDFIANPLHYLALLEQKPRALDQAAPLENWLLSDSVHRLRRLMEARSGKEGRREFIQMLGDYPIFCVNGFVVRLIYAMHIYISRITKLTLHRWQIFCPMGCGCQEPAPGLNRGWPAGPPRSGLALIDAPHRAILFFV
jgi:hypothetical protein